MYLKISILILMIPFLLVSQNNDKIDVFFISNIEGPNIKIVLESNSNKEMDNYKSELLTGVIPNMSLDQFYDEAFNNKRYKLNCNKLIRYWYSQKNNSRYPYSPLVRFTLKNNSPFSAKYEAQENGPSKGRWIGSLNSTANTSSNKKCKLINLTNENGALDYKGRLYFYRGGHCSGFYRIFINDEPYEELICYGSKDQYLFETPRKGKCKFIESIVRKAVVSNSLPYGAVNVKVERHRSDPRNTKKTVLFWTKSVKVKLDNPCQTFDWNLLR